MRWIVRFSQTRSVVLRNLTVTYSSGSPGNCASAASTELAPSPEPAGSVTRCGVVAVAGESDLPLGSIPVGVCAGKYGC